MKNYYDFSLFFMNFLLKLKLNFLLPLSVCALSVLGQTTSTNTLQQIVMLSFLVILGIKRVIAVSLLIQIVMLCWLISPFMSLNHIMLRLPLWKMFLFYFLSLAHLALSLQNLLPLQPHLLMVGMVMCNIDNQHPWILHPHSMWLLITHWILPWLTLS